MTTDSVILAPSGEGADRAEFRREAKAYAAWCQGQGMTAAVELVDAPEHLPWWGNLERFDAALRKHRGVQRVAYMCHGLRSGIMAGYDRGSAGRLVETLHAIDAVQSVHVTLYACSTGGEDAMKGSAPPARPCFARRVRDELNHAGYAGGIILSHATPGHTTRNRELRMWGTGDRTIIGAELVDAPPVAEPFAGALERRVYQGLGEFLSGTPDGRWRAASMTRAELRAAALEALKSHDA
jgi:hypothetical protein